MRPDISEFSYGYAIVDNLLTQIGYPVTAVPIFPSLMEEGQPGGGYDTKIMVNGLPLFLQFKVSDRLKQRNAADASELGLPYFRIHLRPLNSSQQHPMLLELEKVSTLVYYVCPEFDTPVELNRYFLRRQVVEKSRYIRPSLIGEITDNIAHSISFSPGRQPIYRSSQRTLSSLCDADEFLSTLKKELQQTDIDNIHTEKYQRLRDSMIQIVQETRVRPVRQRRTSRAESTEETGSLFELPEAFPTEIANEELAIKNIGTPSRRMIAIDEVDLEARDRTLEEIRHMPSPMAAVQRLSRLFFDCEVLLVRPKEDT